MLDWEIYYPKVIWPYQLKISSSGIDFWRKMADLAVKDINSELVQS